ncbi:MAG: hypothetical protein ACKN94_08875, partial [Pirellulaceae bacterium]
MRGTPVGFESSWESDLRHFQATVDESRIYSDEREWVCPQQWLQHASFFSIFLPLNSGSFADVDRTAAAQRGFPRAEGVHFHCDPQDGHHF